MSQGNAEPEARCAHCGEVLSLEDLRLPTCRFCGALSEITIESPDGATQTAPPQVPPTQAASEDAYRKMVRAMILILIGATIFFLILGLTLTRLLR
jgi:hypothetical protein